MTTIVTFVESAAHWPSMIRGDLLLRAFRLQGSPARHHVVVREGLDAVREAAVHLEIEHSGLHPQADFVDSAQVMVDRLLIAGHAYDAGARIFLPWTGAKGYSPVESMHGRRGRVDIQLWGPHWRSGPVGPSQMLLRWSAVHDLVGGPADWVLGFDPDVVRRAAALANALGHADLAQRFDRPLVEAPRMRQVSPPLNPREARWTALQVKQLYTEAQGRHAASTVYAARQIDRVAPAHPLNPFASEWLDAIVPTLLDGKWRQAVTRLQTLAKRCNRLRSKPKPVAAPLLPRALALFDALKL